MNSDGKSILSIYVGTPENSIEDFLYLDLRIPHRETNLWVSKSLNDCSGEDFLEFLSDALNEATLWAKALGIKIRVESEMILQTAEEFDEQNSKSVRKLLNSID